MRTTDRTLNLSKIFNIQFKDTIFNFQLEYFKKILKNFTKETKIRNIYIASDSKKIKNYIIVKLKEKKYSTFYNNTVFKKVLEKLLEKIF